MTNSKSHRVKAYSGGISREHCPRVYAICRPELAELRHSEDVSEQRASDSLPDSVATESEEERAAREADEMAALDDDVRDYEADPNVMLEDVPQDIVIKTLKVSCACVPVREEGLRFKYKVRADGAARGTGRQHPRGR